MEVIETATNVVKEGMFSFIQSVSELITIPPDDNDNVKGKVDKRRVDKRRVVDVDVEMYTSHPGARFDEWVQGEEYYFEHACWEFVDSCVDVCYYDGYIKTLSELSAL